jgi:hypothetical protein
MIRRRLRDNYMVIYLFLLISWLLKLISHPATNPKQCVGDTFVCHAAVGPIPGQFILMIVFGFYLALALITLSGFPSREPSVEVLSRERTLQKLVSQLARGAGLGQRGGRYAAPRRLT